ncbi:hypothetical protein HPB47_006228 [Ixodes persulcatus]|uniref:Uncharacterized protein n=1 Tax=Ixodes persulcatus TaxID=34615 RepID=A0AC60PB62_IXOPE|nr:hypothetical protein HPB47_006228 [Ixodes persulcatus]
MSPTLRSETKDGEKPEATVDPGACSADAQAELLLKVADMCDAVTQRLTVQQSREPELRHQLTVPVYMGYNNAKSIADFLSITTVGHAQAFGYGYGVGHLGYGLGHFGYGHGLSSYGLNYGYGLGTYGDYATLLRRKKYLERSKTAPFGARIFRSQIWLDLVIFRS